MSFLQPLLPLSPSPQPPTAPLGTFSAAELGAHTPIGAWIFALRQSAQGKQRLPQGVANARHFRRPGEHPVVITR
jgi:hypothetical protein